MHDMASGRMVETFYSIDRERFHYLKFILEGYENLAVLSSAPGHHHTVRLRCSEESLPELLALMQEIAPNIKRLTLS